MSRKPRAIGQFFHVIVRGIGKQILFEDDSDRIKFLELLERYREETEVVIMAYCLMENHVHLMLQDESQEMSLFMKKLGISYASYYNKKYDRTGHLFQDRYKSQVIVDEIGLLNVYRYILNNPAKAFIAKASDYKWSSYKEYGQVAGLTNASMLKELIGSEMSLDDFLEISTDYEGMEEMTIRHDDDWALDVIRKTLSVESGTVLQQLPKVERDEMLAILKEKGISIRQLERLTGINRSVIQRARKRVEKNRPQ